MSDVLIRGLSDLTVKAYDEEAALRRVSRNEVMVERLEMGVPGRVKRHITEADWDRFFAATRDLDDPEVMGAAWR